jgi:prophage regulatory protein
LRVPEEIPVFLDGAALAMPANRHFLIRKAEVKAQTGYCHQHIARLEKKGEFPVRVRLGINAVAWWQDEIDEWLASRPRGAAPQKPCLGPKRAPPEPDPEDLEVLRRLATKFGLDLVPRKPKRREVGSDP